jgi:hypothetical protein
MDLRICRRHPAQGKVLVQEKNSGRKNPAETNELGNHGKNGRAAAGGKILNGRGKNRKGNLRHRHERNGRRADGNLNLSGINVTVRKHRDRTIVVSVAGILVDQLVQAGARRHRVQQQDKGYEQRGENRVAGPLKMSNSELQTICF